MVGFFGGGKPKSEGEDRLSAAAMRDYAAGGSMFDGSRAPASSARAATSLMLSTQAPGLEAINRAGLRSR